MSNVLGKEVETRLLSDPLYIQSFVLDELQSRLGGNEAVADSNSAFCFLLEATSSIAAHAIIAADNEVMRTYKHRAQTSEDLYKHMSDFDYLGLFSTYASIYINHIFDKKYLIDNAVPFNNNYKKVIIPQGTVYSIGKYRFGMFYPIEILINSATDLISVQYDATVKNPLFQLQTNLIEQVEYTQSGMQLLALKIPAYQFEMSEYLEDQIPGMEFVKTYSYLNRFYAVRVFTNDETGIVWKELNQTLSETIYNPSEPTAKVILILEDNQVRIQIPQIYVDNGLIGSKVRVQVYNTLGELDVDISNIPVSSNVVNFDLANETSDKFAYVLDSLSTQIIAPIGSVIKGGFNGYDFEELKRKVVTNSLYGNCIITPSQLTAYFSDRGFKIQKYRDNITDRIYFAYKELTDSEGTIIPSTHLPTQLYLEKLKDVKSIRVSTDGTVTILPTTMYKYQDSIQGCIPVKDTEIDILQSMNNNDLVTHYNSNIYTRSPFHILLENYERYARATSFNLLATDVTNIMFEHENLDLASRMVTYSAVLIHLDEGAGGYLLRFAVTKSADIAKFPESDVAAFVMTTTVTGQQIGTRARYSGTDGINSIYEVYLGSNYHLTRRGTTGSISITTLTEIGDVYESRDLMLESKFELVLMVSSKQFPDVYNNDWKLTANVPENYLSEYLVLTRQSMMVHFGHSLEDIVYNTVDTRNASSDYLRHQITEYHTYPEDVVATDENGTPLYEVIDGLVTPIIKYRKGDTVIGIDGDPVVKYEEGSLVYDAYGNAIPLGDRVIYYMLHMLQISVKLFISQYPAHVAYVKDLTSQLEEYFKVLRLASAELIETTDLFFRPVKTIGSAMFDSGDGVIIRQPLDVTFKVKFFVPEFVTKDDNIKTTIEQTAIQITEKSLATGATSMVDIASLIRNSMSEYITSVNIYGMNGSHEFQTLVIKDTDAVPTLARLAYIANDGTISIRAGFDCEFVALNATLA